MERNKTFIFWKIKFQSRFIPNFFIFICLTPSQKSETYQGQCGPGQKPSWAGLPLNGEVRLSCHAALLGQDYLQLKHGQVVTTLNTFWDNSYWLARPLQSGVLPSNRKFLSLLSKVVFCQRSSSVKVHLPSKVVFCLMLSSVKGPLLPKVVFLFWVIFIFGF